MSGISICEKNERKPQGLESSDLECKQAEAGLGSKEERFRVILENMDYWIWEVDSKGRYTDCSKSVEKILGYFPQELIGKTPFDLMDPHETERVKEVFTRIVSEKKPIKDLENWNIHKDGRRVCFLTNGVPIMDANGELRGYRGVDRDITERKRAEEALRESERTYKNVFNNAYVGLFRSRLSDGRIVMANKRMAEIFGYKTIDDCINNYVAIEHYVYPEMRDELIIPLTRDGAIDKFEAPIRKDDGSIVWVQFSGSLSSEDGCFEGIAIDITEHKRTQKALLESHETFSKAFQTSPYAITITRAENGKLIEVNNTFTSMSGFSREEALASSSIGLNLWADEGDRQQVVDDLRAGRAVVSREYQFRTKSGKVIIGLFSAQVLQLAQGQYILSSINDITKRKQTEDRLSVAYNALDSSINGIVITNREGKINYANPAFLRMFGYTDRNQIKDKQADEVFPSQLIEKISDLEEIIDKSKNQPEEFSTKRKDGTVFHVEVASSMVIDRNGHNAGWMASFVDITKRKDLNTQLIQAQRMESVGRLASGVAHDYNNVLSVIMGFTQLAMGEKGLTESLRADLEEILKATNRAAGITRQLLAFARKQIIAPMVLDLNKSVESMIKMIRRLIGEDINFEWSPGSMLWSIKMDPSQIDQILANLCVNARDAITGVGKITIETKMMIFDSAYCADHHGFIPGEFVMLAVSDNGCGMDKEIVDNVFEPFFTTKDKDKGTGLGLSMVYGIVKQNNGFINVYSEPGIGTTIRIYLPRHEGEAVTIQDKNSEKICLGCGETILVVEDDRSILKLARRILDELGYIVLTANSPKEAIKLFKEHAGKIHLLLTDVIMPEMNGLELANSLESLCPGLKRVFMSGYTSNAIAHHGVLDEGVHFIQKPFFKEDLAKTIRKAMDE
ncbi:MAG: PAS domain S-box protein [Pseudomonadota bacterium]